MNNLKVAVKVFKAFVGGLGKGIVASMFFIYWLEGAEAIAKDVVNFKRKGA